MVTQIKVHPFSLLHRLIWGTQHEIKNWLLYGGCALLTWFSDIHIQQRHTTLEVLFIWNESINTFGSMPFSYWGALHKSVLSELITFFVF